MAIVFSPSKISSEFDNYDSDAVLTSEEKEALEFIKKAFDDAALDFTRIVYRRRSKDYLSLVIGDNIDFCRIKATARSVWFSVLAKHLPDEIKTDLRFEGNKKTALHWKVKLTDISDFANNSDLIAESFASII